MLQIASKCQIDQRNSLKKKIMIAMQQRRKTRGDQIEDLDELVFYGPNLKRALLGGMPKYEGFDEDNEPSKKSSGSSRTRFERASSASNRTRRYVLGTMSWALFSHLLSKSTSNCRCVGLAVCLI